MIAPVLPEIDLHHDDVNPPESLIDDFASDRLVARLVTLCAHLKFIAGICHFSTHINLVEMGVKAYKRKGHTRKFFATMDDPDDQISSRLNIV